VAGKWRIRHKLILGLLLVIGITALQLAATLKGLLAYSATMKSMESKTGELIEADKLRSAINDLARPIDSLRNGAEAMTIMTERRDLVEKALKAYEARLQDTLQRKRDPGKGRDEIGLIAALQQRIVALDQALDEYKKPSVRPLQASQSILDDKRIKRAIADLIQPSDQLRETILHEQFERITEAKDHYRNSMILVIATSIGGVLLLVTLQRFLYKWVFYPIRDLEQGVGRVARGDFEHRIEVHSGDEMEDLAAAFNDMTSRLRTMYRDLEHQVNERSRQLVRSEHLASVGFLAAGVAHEINNPLASIAFCSEALESRWRDTLARFPAADVEVVAKYLQMIQKAAFRCKEITQRLLEFSRTGERRREPADLAEIIQGVLELVQHLPNCKGKRILFQPVGHFVALVNSQEISSVVLNLVVNALDSMEEGGTLTIGLTEQGGQAEMTFQDTGCGMPPEVLENIFEPFFTRSRTGKGTGLGLSISHRIITQHGGEIVAVSPGQDMGSTFTVRLPLEESETEARTPGPGMRGPEHGAEARSPWPTRKVA
jgi:signal transduction histidine kinase